MSTANGQSHVLVLGAGMAGLACARRLADDEHVRVTLVDRHNYHQFQPLLYQVATSQIAPSDIAFQMRKLFRDKPNVDIKLADVAGVDPAARAVTMTEAAADGRRARDGAGSLPNFFRTPGRRGARIPALQLDDAARLRSRILGVFEDADRDPALLDQGALNFIVVGGGPTGVETAGALGDMIRDTMRAEFHDLAVSAARVLLVDAGHALLSAVLGDGPRLRGQGPAAQGRRAASRRRVDRDRRRPRRRSPTARPSRPAA